MKYYEMENYRDKQLLDYYRKQEELEEAYEKEFSEECQKYVLEAIETECRVKDPVRFAEMNYSIYKVAMEAVQQALYHERTYNRPLL